jgi:hypothetical protein
MSGRGFVDFFVIDTYIVTECNFIVIDKILNDFQAAEMVSSPLWIEV